MRFLFSFIIVGLLSSSAFASTPAPVQFKNGNNIDVEGIYGSVTYYCRDNQGKNYTRHWNCSADLVSPGTHDYVISQTPIDADKVTLTSTRQDGSTKSKSVKFNSQKSESSTRVNLLTKTLTQSPLLKVGNNSINYKFTKGKTVVNEGVFASKVTVIGDTQCRHRAVFANTESQCIHQTNGCDHYFYLENNCQY